MSPQGRARARGKHSGGKLPAAISGGSFCGSKKLCKEWQIHIYLAIMKISLRLDTQSILGGDGSWIRGCAI
jgi:hypothetical protein